MLRVISHLGFVGYKGRPLVGWVAGLAYYRSYVTKEYIAKTKIVIDIGISS